MRAVGLGSHPLFETSRKPCWPGTLGRRVMLAALACVAAAAEARLTTWQNGGVWLLPPLLLLAAWLARRGWI